MSRSHNHTGNCANRRIRSGINQAGRAGSAHGNQALSRRAFYCDGVTLEALIQRAWDVKDFQITGGPELDQMIQSMLRDRFRLEIHRETKDMPIYSLMVAKSGPKLTPTTATMQTWSRGNGSLVGTNGTSAGIDPWTGRNAGD